MEEAVESGVLSGDPFSNQYEVNSNEKGYTEGTIGKVETGGGGVGLVGTEDTGISAVGGGTSTDGVHTIGKREEGFNGGAHHGEAGMEPVYHHGDEDDVVMADLDEEEHGVMEAGGGDAGPVVTEGIHGNGGTDHSQAGVLT